ncbi:MAG: hypothetical protein KR126chlam2_01388, partial [Chlamydiae bacterium]|nr:hypothetical protein [Chlamydiota bacterium]
MVRILATSDPLAFSPVLPPAEDPDNNTMTKVVPLPGIPEASKRAEGAKKPWWETAGNVTLFVTVGWIIYPLMNYKPISKWIYKKILTPIGHGITHAVKFL